MTESLAIAGFVVCALVIFFAGSRLSYYGDRIATLSGWDGAWIGLALMASVTSLPELVVGISSVSWVGSADLAVGDVLGSCAINLLILASLDAFVPARQRLFGLASQSHVLAAALGIVLLGFVGVGILSREPLALTPWIGASSAVFLVIYFVSIRLIFRHYRGVRAASRIEEIEQAEHVEDELSDEDAATSGTAAEGMSLGRVLLRYTGYAAVVVVAAIMLPPAAEVISQMSGLAESFVGTVFVALSTSLPELAVSIAAIRMNAIDLAVGNILGSNLFNVLILAIDDLFYTRGLLLESASPSHVFTVLSVIAMSGIVIIALTFSQQTKRYLLASDALLILAAYVGNAAILLSITPR